MRWCIPSAQKMPYPTGNRPASGLYIAPEESTRRVGRWCAKAPRAIVPAIRQLKEITIQYPNPRTIISYYSINLTLPAEAILVY